MKKTILSLSLVALFSVAANAQEPVKKTQKQEEKPKTVNADGTTNTTVTEKKDEEPVKKGGTRMAINEKGTSGGIKPKGKTEEKKTESPAGQPGSGGKKD